MAKSFHTEHLKTTNVYAVQAGALNVSGDFLPLVSGNFDLGSAAKYWDNVFINKVRLSGQVLDILGGDLRYNSADVITTDNISDFLASGSGVSFDDANYTANGIQTIYSTSGTIENINNVLVSIDGLMQRPNVDFIIASNNVVFSTAPATDSVLLIKNLKGTSSTSLVDTSCAGTTYNRCDEMTMVLLSSVFH